MNSESDFAVCDEAQERIEDSVAIFIIPFILALGVAAFFVMMEIFTHVL